MITFADYQKIFQKDETGSYVSLVIPKTKELPELNLTGKNLKDYTIDDIIRLKKYAGEMFRQVDKSTITD